MRAESFKHWLLAEKFTWADAGNVRPHSVTRNVPLAAGLLIKNEKVLGKQVS